MARELVVVPATTEHTELVKHFYDIVIEANSGTKYDVLWRRDLHPSDASIEEAIENGTLYAAFIDDEMVGAGILNDDFARGYESVPWKVDAPLEEVRALHLFCTHPNMHGRGLGAAFLRGLLDEMRVQGVKAVRLDVFAYNDPAKHLYEKVGFELVTSTYLTYEDQEVSQILFDMYEIAV